MALHVVHLHLACEEIKFHFRFLINDCSLGCFHATFPPIQLSLHRNLVGNVMSGMLLSRCEGDRAAVEGGFKSCPLTSASV